jgi:hypothetical protein
MSGFKKFGHNIYCNPYIFINYCYWALSISKIKGKDQFWSKTLFFLFFSPSIREIRESHWNPMLERKNKSPLTLITNTKKVEIWVKLLLLMRGAHIKSLFTLKPLRKTYLILVRFFISGWFRVLGWFFEVMNEFIKLPIMFSRCFW